MSMSTEAIDIIDHLQKDGINRETAKELIDFVEKQRGDLATKQDVREIAVKQDYLKWITGIGFVALLSLMIYLHSDTKAEMNRRFTKMEAEMKEIKQLLQRERR